MVNISEPFKTYIILIDILSLIHLQNFMRFIAHLKGKTSVELIQPIKV